MSHQCSCGTYATCTHCEARNVFTGGAVCPTCNGTLVVQVPCPIHAGNTSTFTPYTSSPYGDGSSGGHHGRRDYDNHGHGHNHGSSSKVSSKQRSSHRKH